MEAIVKTSRFESNSSSESIKQMAEMAICDITDKILTWHKFKTDDEVRDSLSMLVNLGKLVGNLANSDSINSSHELIEFLNLNYGDSITVKKDPPVN
jgi:hypothetical protein